MFQSKKRKQFLNKPQGFERKHKRAKAREEKFNGINMTKEVVDIKTTLEVTSSCNHSKIQKNNTEIFTNCKTVDEVYQKLIARSKEGDEETSKILLKNAMSQFEIWQQLFNEKIAALVKLAIGHCKESILNTLQNEKYKNEELYYNKWNLIWKHIDENCLAPQAQHIIEEWHNAHQDEAMTIQEWATKCQLLSSQIKRLGWAVSDEEILEKIRSKCLTKFAPLSLNDMECCKTIEDWIKYATTKNNRLNNVFGRRNTRKPCQICHKMHFGKCHNRANFETNHKRMNRHEEKSNYHPQKGRQFGNRRDTKGPYTPVVASIDTHDTQKIAEIVEDILKKKGIRQEAVQ